MAFGRRKANPVDDFDEDDDIEFVLFKGAMDGTEANLAENAKLVQVGLDRAKGLVTDALSRRAEKIRLDPKGDRVAMISLSVDGQAFSGGRITRQEGNAITQMLKLLAGLDIKNRSKPQKGGIHAEYNSTSYELLVETAPLKTGGERLTIRCINTLSRIDTPADAGFPEAIKERIRELTSERRGVILISGPPDSGVSTTAIATLRSIDAYLYNIFNCADLGGREILHVTNFSGEEGDTLEQRLARAIRKECDVIFVDPIKTPEAIKNVFDVADQVALVGEMPAANGPAAILQAAKWIGTPKTVAQNLSAIISPKLIRKLCTDCREAYRPNAKLIQKVGLPPETNVLYRQPKQRDEETGEIMAVPCLTCGGLGYFGRTVMLEFIQMSDELRESVGDGATAAEIKALAKSQKMPTHRSEGLRLVGEGVTSLEELQRSFQA